MAISEKQLVELIRLGHEDRNLEYKESNSFEVLREKLSQDRNGEGEYS